MKNTTFSVTEEFESKTTEQRKAMLQQLMDEYIKQKLGEDRL